MAKIIIRMDSGMVQDVLSDDPSIQVEILDLDTQYIEAETDEEIDSETKKVEISNQKLDSAVEQGALTAIY